VLGIIRPTAEVIGTLTATRHIGVLATEGTIRSDSYRLEIEKLWPGITVSGKACPLWVPLVEMGEAQSPGADYFVQKYINELITADPLIDAVILGCTHYPLLLPKIRRFMPPAIRVIPQGSYVATSLADYLHRHPDMEQRCSQHATVRYLTTEDPQKFSQQARLFLSQADIQAEHIVL
jgi:glutamate racemase